MSRFLGRSLALDIAAALLVVLAVVSVVDIDDYGAHRAAAISPLDRSAGSSAAPRDFAVIADPATASDHVCACLLCTVTIPDTPGTRVMPPTAGKLRQSAAGMAADSPCPLEIFHPPSA